MKQILKKGETSVITFIFIQDSSSTTGAGLTGLAYDTGSLVASYIRPGAARQAFALATQTVGGAFSAGGFVEVDATNMPGVYRLDIIDAVLAAGVDNAIVMLKGATNMAPLLLEIQLTDLDLNTASVPQSVKQAGWVGDYELGDTVEFAFATTAALTAGATINVYKNDGNTAISPGLVTLEEDFGSETNVHQVSIALTDSSYDPKADYVAVLSGATIGTDTVTAVIATFSIENRSQRAAYRQIAK